MKKLLGLLTIVGTLLLAGCSGGGANVPPPTLTTSSTGIFPSRSDTTADDVYLRTLRNRYPEYVSVDSSLLITTGKNMCLRLDSGEPLVHLLMQSVDPPLTRDMWAYNVGVAVAAYCPQYANDIKQLSQTLGG